MFGLVEKVFAAESSAELLCGTVVHALSEKSVASAIVMVQEKFTSFCYTTGCGTCQLILARQSSYRRAE